MQQVTSWLHELDKRVESLTYSLIAGWAGIGKAEYFELANVSDRTPPPVTF